MNDVNCNVQCWIEMRCFNLFYVTFKNVSAIFVTAHGCADGLKKKLNLWSGFPCNRYFIGFLLCPSKHRHGDTLFPRIRRNRYRTPLSRCGIQQTLKRYVWNFWSCISHFLGVEFPSPSQPLRNWYRAWIVIGRSIVRAALSASHSGMYLWWQGD